jgi:hypothetical protein
MWTFGGKGNIFCRNMKEQNSGSQNVPFRLQEYQELLLHKRNRIPVPGRNSWNGGPKLQERQHRNALPSNDGAKIDGDRCHTSSAKDMIGKYRDKGGGGAKQQCCSSSNQAITKKHN